MTILPILRDDFLHHKCLGLFHVEEDENHCGHDPRRVHPTAKSVSVVSKYVFGGHEREVSPIPCSSLLWSHAHDDSHHTEDHHHGKYTPSKGVSILGHSFSEGIVLVRHFYKASPKAAKGFGFEKNSINGPIYLDCVCRYLAASVGSRLRKVRISSLLWIIDLLAAMRSQNGKYGVKQRMYCEKTVPVRCEHIERSKRVGLTLHCGKRV